METRKNKAYCSLKKERKMKNLAIIGVMFLSLGAFAQQNSNIEVKQQEKVCVIQRDHAQQPQKSNRMITAPIQNAPKHSHLRNSSKVQRNHAHKGHVNDQRMVVPMKRKNVQVRAKQ